MPRKADSDTRLHFRTFADDNHAQKRAFCLHCQKDACADNIQRMKNHLQRCEAYQSTQSAERLIHNQLQPADSSAVTDASMTRETPNALASAPSQPGAGGPGLDTQTAQATAQGIDLSGPPNMQPANTAHHNNMMGAPSSTSREAAREKAVSNALNNVRMAMARSTSRLTDLENVLKTQLQDGMHNAATHVRAAIRDERDRLFKLAQTLVAQETKIREAQNILSGI